MAPPYAPPPMSRCGKSTVAVSALSSVVLFEYRSVACYSKPMFSGRLTRRCHCIKRAPKWVHCLAFATCWSINRQPLRPQQQCRRQLQQPRRAMGMSSASNYSYNGWGNWTEQIWGKTVEVVPKAADISTLFIIRFDISEKKTYESFVIFRMIYSTRLSMLTWKYVISLQLEPFQLIGWSGKANLCASINIVRLPKQYYNPISQIQLWALLERNIWRFRQRHHTCITRLAILTWKYVFFFW